MTSHWRRRVGAPPRVWGRRLPAPRGRYPGPSGSRDPAAGSRRGVGAAPRLCCPDSLNVGAGCAPSPHSGRTAHSCADKCAPTGARTGRRCPEREAALEQAAGGRRPVGGGGGSGVGREEEGSQLAAALGPSLSSLLALAAALTLSIAVASTAVAAGAGAAVEPAAVAFATVFEVSLAAGLDPRSWPRRRLAPQYCH